MLWRLTAALPHTTEGKRSAAERFLTQTSWTIVNFARPISILWVNCIPSVPCVTLLSSYTVHLVHLIRTLGRRYAVMHNFGLTYNSSPWLLISTTSCYLVTPFQVPVGHVRMYVCTVYPMQWSFSWPSCPLWSVPEDLLVMF